MASSAFRVNPQRLRIAVLSFDDPWGESHGGTQRTLLFLDTFRALGHDPVCVFAGALSDADAVARREGSGFEAVGVRGGPAGETIGAGRLGALKRRYLPMPTIRGGRIDSLRAALASSGPYDMLVTQQLRGATYLDCAPGALLWLDQADLWSQFARVEAKSRRGLRSWTAQAQSLGFRRAEARFGRSAAIATAAGHGDSRRFAEITGREVGWLPNTVAQVVSYPTDVSRSAAPTVGLLANFRYWPNLDAYELLRTQWLPRLRESGWQVLVAGYGSEALTPSEGIRLVGAVSSPVDFYASIDAALSPVRLGAGIKVKVLEALCANKPVFASKASLDGFQRSDLPGVFEIEERPQGFPSPDAVRAISTVITKEGRMRFDRLGFADTVGTLLSKGFR